VRARLDHRRRWRRGAVGGGSFAGTLGDWLGCLVSSWVGLGIAEGKEAIEAMVVVVGWVLRSLLFSGGKPRRRAGRGRGFPPRSSYF
jgi:hypothetical protein